MLVDDIRLKSCLGGVYEPLEDSMLLAKAVEKHAFGKFLDLGTGTGIQGIVAAKKGCAVTFADIDDKAIECAKANAADNSVTGEFCISDLFDGVTGKFNTIAFNPPYLPDEPELGMVEREYALDGGIGGRELIDRFLSSYASHVEEDHIVLLVESSLNGYETDADLLKAEVTKVHYSFEDIAVLAFK